MNFLQECRTRNGYDSFNTLFIAFFMSVSVISLFIPNFSDFTRTVAFPLLSIANDSYKIRLIKPISLTWKEVLLVATFCNNILVPRFLEES